LKEGVTKNEIKQKERVNAFSNTTKANHYFSIQFVSEMIKIPLHYGILFYVERPTQIYLFSDLQNKCQSKKSLGKKSMSSDSSNKLQELNTAYEELVQQIEAEEQRIESRTAALDQIREQITEFQNAIEKHHTNIKQLEDNRQQEISACKNQDDSDFKAKLAEIDALITTENEKKCEAAALQDDLMMGEESWKVDRDIKAFNLMALIERRKEIELAMKQLVEGE
jgi:chromosome segregation ATPase